jgi:hypothetical protein
MDTVVITATDENGFFTRAGPLQIFVSRHVSVGVGVVGVW